MISYAEWRATEPDVLAVAYGWKPLQLPVMKLSQVPVKVRKAAWETEERDSHGEWTAGGEDDNYRGNHRPASPSDDAGTSAPMHDRTRVYPEDIYDKATQVRNYGNREHYDQESFRQVNAVRGNPEAQVPIYRAVGPEVPEGAQIRAGDWVTPSREYAQQHNDSQFNGEGRVLTTTARAGDLWTDGNSINEFGWWPSQKAYAGWKTAKQFPGWKHDVKITDHYTRVVQDAMRSSLSGIYRAVIEAHREYAKMLPVEKALGDTSMLLINEVGAAAREVITDAATIPVVAAEADHNYRRTGSTDPRAIALHEMVMAMIRRHVKIDVDALNEALAGIYADGYLVGASAAAELSGGGVLQWLSQLEQGVNWDTWTPGNPAAALRDAQGGLSDLLEQRGITIQGISGTTLDNLGDTISTGLANGDGVNAIRSSVLDYVDDPNRASMIARTETARAVTAATVDSYNAMGVQQVDWMTAPGCCDLCLDMEDDNPYLIDDVKDQLPLHPNCRCSLDAVVIEDSALNETDTPDDYELPDVAEMGDGGDSEQ